MRVTLGSVSDESTVPLLLPVSLASPDTVLATSTVACDGADVRTTLVLRTGVVRAVVNGVLSAPRQCVSVLPPVAPVEAVVRIIAPAVIGLCDTLFLDGGLTLLPH